MEDQTGPRLASRPEELGNQHGLRSARARRSGELFGVAVSPRPREDKHMDVSMGAADTSAMPGSICGLPRCAGCGGDHGRDGR